MASAEVYLFVSNGRSQTGAGLPVLATAPTSQQTITTSTSQVRTTIAVPAGADVQSTLWRVQAVGGAIRVLGGSVAPTAVRASGSEAGWYVADGQSLDMVASLVGEKLSVIDA